jgi:hypothetical protein
MATAPFRHRPQIMRERPLFYHEQRKRQIAIEDIPSLPAGFIRCDARTRRKPLLPFLQRLFLQRFKRLMFHAAQSIRNEEK